ncbi:MAG: Gfo/Idh/MocA family oxidoreductase [Granulosicoccus sp.]
MHTFFAEYYLRRIFNHSCQYCRTLDAIDESREPLATIEHALQAQRLIEALVESAEHKVQVTINHSL